MSFIAKKLRQDRFKLISDAQAMIENDSADGQSIEAFDNMMIEADALMEKISRVERAAAEAAKIDDIIGASAEKSRVSVAERGNDIEHYKAGFVAAMREAAKIPLTERDKTALQDYRNAASVANPGTGTAGGITIQTELMNQIFAAMILEGGVRPAVRILQTASGNPIDLPMNDDTAAVGAQVNENTSLGSAADLVFSKATLHAWKYTSGVALISTELLQDSIFSFDQFVMEQLSHRLARVTNLAYTTGNGTTGPQGLVTAASLGKQGATGQVSTVIYNDLVDMEHSVAVPYRRSASWMFPDSFFKTIKRLTDTLGRPLWAPSLAVGQPDSILGYNIYLNADLATPAASSKSALFGDMKQFIVRDVLDLNFTILHELYAATGQVGVVGLLRTDSRLASVGNCLTYYQQSAT